METIIFNKYKNAEIIFKEHINLFLKCKRAREIINVLQVPEDKFIYAYNKNDKIIISTPKYSKAKLYIDNIWFNNYLNIKEPEIDFLPQEIILNEDECFKTPEGKKYNIRVYGERDITKCFLSVKDIEKELEYERLQNYIIRECASYEENEDYKYFLLSKKTIRPAFLDSKKTVKKRMFLTYNGFIKMLYITKNKQARGLRDWITKIIYTIHMGSKKERSNLISDVLGYENKIAIDILKISLNSITCVYFIILGYRKDIFPDDCEDYEYDIICKFGFTICLSRRFKEHQEKFHKRFNVDIKLKYYCNINESYLVEAENKLHSFFKDYKYTTQNDKELISYPVDDIKKVKKLYKDIGKLCIGNVDKLEQTIKDKDHEIELLNMELKNNRLEKEVLQLKLDSKK